MTVRLPTEWARRQLRQLHLGGVSNLDPINFSDEQFEYYSIPAYQNGTAPTVAYGREILSQKLALPLNCVLFGKLNPRVEKVWNVRSSGTLRLLGSTEWLPIVPTAEVDQDFIYFLLRSEWVMPIAQGLTSGSTPSRERVEPKSFYDIEVPLPPLPEQRSIAALLRRFETAIELQCRALNAAKALKRAAMRELFAKGLRGEAQKETGIGPIPESWEAVRIGALGRVGNGSTPKRTIAEYWNDGHFPWLTSAKVYDREIEAADEFVTDRALAECHLPRVQPGAVLMAITGQGKTLGHCAVLKIEASVSQHVAYMVLDPQRADPGFVRGYLETQYDALRQVASGGGSTKGALTCAYLRDLPIPLPPVLQDQRDIVAILDTLDRKVSLHVEKRSILEAIFKSLLHNLMTGEVRIADLDLGALASLKPEAA